MKLKCMESSSDDSNENKQGLPTFSKIESISYVHLSYLTSSSRSFITA
jgi:hypothetical protein